MAARLFLAIMSGALAMTLPAAAQEKPAAWALPPEDDFCDDCTLPPEAALPKPNPFAVFLPIQPRLIPRSGKPQIPPVTELRSGETKLSLCVERTGEATKVAVASSSGDARLDEAAIEFASQATFTPSRWLGIALRKCGHNIVVVWSFEDN